MEPQHRQYGPALAGATHRARTASGVKPDLVPYVSQLWDERLSAGGRVARDVDRLHSGLGAFYDWIGGLMHHEHPAVDQGSIVRLDAFMTASEFHFVELMPTRLEGPPHRRIHYILQERVPTHRAKYPVASPDRGR